MVRDPSVPEQVGDAALASEPKFKTANILGAVQLGCGHGLQDQRVTSLALGHTLWPKPITAGQTY